LEFRVDSVKPSNQRLETDLRARSQKLAGLGCSAFAFEPVEKPCDCGSEFGGPLRIKSNGTLSHHFTEEPPGVSLGKNQGYPHFISLILFNPLPRERLFIDEPSELILLTLSFAFS
jgi:hypothetical protein